MDVAAPAAAQETSKQAKAPGIPVSPPNASTLAPKPAEQPIDPKIKKIAGEFESMVIGELLAPMFNTIDTSGPFGGGSAEAMFRPMLVDEYAKNIAKAGGIGIADEVAREMMRLQAGAAGAAPADPAHVMAAMAAGKAATAAEDAKGETDAAGR